MKSSSWPTGFSGEGWELRNSSCPTRRREKGTIFFSPPHRPGLDGRVDFINPVPDIAEKKGTLTNIDGRVQAFAAGLDFEGDGLPEWRALLDLAKELRVETKYFWPLTSPEAVFRALQQEISFFRS